MTRVLDASSVLAVLFREPGHEVVAPLLDGALLSTANLAEVVGKALDRGVDVRLLAQRLVAAGVVIEPLTSDDAVLAGSLRSVEGGARLSLGDRCCLALALRGRDGEVLTADRAWAELDLPLRVQLLR